MKKGGRTIEHYHNFSLKLDIDRPGYDLLIRKKRGTYEREGHSAFAIYGQNERPTYSAAD